MCVILNIQRDGINNCVVRSIEWCENSQQKLTNQAAELMLRLLVVPYAFQQCSPFSLLIDKKYKHLSLFVYEEALFPEIFCFRRKFTCPTRTMS